MKAFRLLVVVILLGGCSGVSTIKESNDWFSTGGHSDRNYTQGIEIAHKTGDNDNTLSKVSSVLPSFSPSHPIVEFSSISLGQRIYTPEDLTKKELILNDNPYAGWLYTEITRHSVVEEVSLSTSLSVGVVGPHSYAEQVQTKFHEWCDCQTPYGWDNQLQDEPALLLTHSRSWKEGEDETFLKMYYDHQSDITFRAGNVFTDFTYAKTFRIGIDDFSNHTEYNGWLFMRMGVQAVARNIFYDGNTFKESHSVDKNPMVGFLTPGIHFECKGVGVDLSIVARTNDYAEQTGKLQTYGMLSFGLTPQKFTSGED